MKRVDGLARLVGVAIHDALLERFTGITEATTIREEKGKHFKHGRILEYMIPPVSSVPWSRIDAMAATHVNRGQAEIMRVAEHTNGALVDVAYAPEIDTLFIRRVC